MMDAYSLKLLKCIRKVKLADFCKIDRVFSCVSAEVLINSGLMTGFMPG